VPDSGGSGGILRTANLSNGRRGGPFENGWKPSTRRDVSCLRRWHRKAGRKAKQSRTRTSSAASAAAPRTRFLAGTFAHACGCARPALQTLDMVLLRCWFGWNARVKNMDNEAEATEKTKPIVAAYECIGTAGARREYEREQGVPDQPSPWRTRPGNSASAATTAATARVDGGANRRRVCPLWNLLV
jgi:hypothetical protein